MAIQHLYATKELAIGFRGITIRATQASIQQSLNLFISATSIDNQDTVLAKQIAPSIKIEPYPSIVTMFRQGSITRVSDFVEVFSSIVILPLSVI
jgi:hypothetical protein